jgi:hypothetical protein
MRIGLDERVVAGDVVPSNSAQVPLTSLLLIPVIADSLDNSNRRADSGSLAYPNGPDSCEDLANGTDPNGCNVTRGFLRSVDTTFGRRRHVWRSTRPVTLLGGAT